MASLTVFTPSHRADHLLPLYESLKAQTFKDFRWVVAANGDQFEQVIAAARSFGDPRTLIVKAPYQMGGIGALKKFACQYAVGDLYVELDHDDWLHPSALRTLWDAYEATGAGFLFSECLGLKAGDEGERYRLADGWKVGTHRYNDRDYDVMCNFEVSPRSLCEIYYAPNHVRAWSAKAYHRVGGHDESLAVCDDQDLMCRTYLAGETFCAIPEVLYYQRLHDANTSALDNGRVRRTSLYLRDKYLHPLVYEWCRRQGLVMIDLGGAFNCPKEHGFLSLDRHPRADIVADVTMGIPWANGRVGCLRAFDFLEHVAGDRVVSLFNDAYDKLAPGGWFLTKTPAVSDGEGRVGRGAFQDPTHKSFWSENNFWYYTNAEFAQYVPESRGKFQAARLFTDYPSDWHRRHQVPYVTADLLSLRGVERVPGLRLI